MHFGIRDIHHLAISLPKISGGYELRNPFFKGVCHAKGYKSFMRGRAESLCFLFEGFYGLSGIPYDSKNGEQWPGTIGLVMVYSIH